MAAILDEVQCSQSQVRTTTQCHTAAVQICTYFKLK